jgi:putative ABC transport system permease protein
MSLARVLNVNKGFSVEQVVAADIQLPPQSYSDVARRKSFYDRSVGAIQALPGVLSVGWVNLLPLEGHGTVSLLYTPGETTLRPETTPLAMYRVANPGYFQAMGIPLLAGRTFTERDHGGKVVIVSQSVTERFWPGENPIGKICVINWGGDRPVEVVGVVSDVRTVRLDEPPAMMVYLPDSHGQEKAGPPASVSIIIRTTNPQATAAAVRQVLQNIDPDVPVRALRPMDQVVSKSLGVRRFQMSLALLFAACALFLAALGIYGVLSYSVEQRRGELGIRMALGAQTGDLRRLVIRQGMTPVAVGLGCGLISALLLGRFVRSLLFGLSAQDPLTIVLVALVVVAAAGLACYIPAARMTRLEPFAALRCE